MNPSDRNTWATPPDFFDALDKVFNFDLDVCASKENTKVSHFFSQDEDGLKQDWSDYTCWLNPPYGRKLLLPWVKKAAESKARVVALLPGGTDTKWFHTWVAPHAQIFFVQGRLQFVPPAGVQASSNKLSSIIAVYGYPERVRLTSVERVVEPLRLHDGMACR